MRANSNTVFNVRYFFVKLLKHLNSKCDIVVQQRDFDLTEKLTFRKKIDFLNALNNARGEVNRKLRLKNLFQMLENRISKSDFSFIDYKMKGKAKTNELLKVIVLRINELITGRIRKPEAQTFNSYPLYTITYKEGHSYLFEPHKFSNTTRLVQRKIQVYEKELLRINRLINNRKTVIQYLIILSELTGLETDNNIMPDMATINSEKTFLFNKLTGNEYTTINQGAKDFDNTYLPKISDVITPHSPLESDFDTSLENSVFNHTTTEDAYYKGETFFHEYQKFHGYKDADKGTIEVKKKEAVFLHPQFDFDGHINLNK